MLNLDCLSGVLSQAWQWVCYVLNFDWLSGVPIEIARWVFLVLFIIIGGLVWLVPAEYVFEGAPDRRWWRDLRLWAVFVLATIFVTYYIL